MSEMNNHLYTDDSQTLQIPFSEYKDLITAVEEARRLQEIKNTVMEDLQALFGKDNNSRPSAAPVKAEEKIKDKTAASERVSVEFSAEEPAEAERTQEEDTAHAGNSADSEIQVPPIKKDIAEHFNRLDSSGRLFNVFKQYYTCMNDACGGTVRVTIKDGVCSLWNYDEWEEFCFVDIFENHLRIAINPRYTDELKSLDLCEVPKLLASRGNLICVQVDDLNNTILAVLNKAFSEVGKVNR